VAVQLLAVIQMAKHSDQQLDGRAARFRRLDEARAVAVRETLRQLVIAARPVSYCTTLVRQFVGNNKALVIVSMAATVVTVATRSRSRVMGKFEAARDEFLARRRITEARRRLAGPLLSAAVDADRHLRMMLAYGDDSNYIRSHFKDKPEVVVMSAIYELSRFIHYRWLLHIKMKDENVEYTDSWYQCNLGRNPAFVYDSTALARPRRAQPPTSPAGTAPATGSLLWSACSWGCHWLRDRRTSSGLTALAVLCPIRCLLDCANAWVYSHTPVGLCRLSKLPGHCMVSTRRCMH